MEITTQSYLCVAAQNVTECRELKIVGSHLTHTCSKNSCGRSRQRQRRRTPRHGDNFMSDASRSRTTPNPPMHVSALPMSLSFCRCHCEPVPEAPLLDHVLQVRCYRSCVQAYAWELVGDVRPYFSSLIEGACSSITIHRIE